MPQAIGDPKQLPPVSFFQSAGPYISQGANDE